MTTLGFLLLILASDPTILGLIVAHKFVAGVIAYAIFSAVVDGMPAPDASSGRAYRWLHASVNLLALNIVRVVSAFFPRFAQIFGRAGQPPQE